MSRRHDVIQVDRVCTSCGWGVPVMHFSHHRTGLERRAARQGRSKLDDDRAQKKARSIDGLPAFDS